MRNERWFSVPKGMKKETVAKTLYVYLDGSMAAQDNSRGPFWEARSPDKWQLDGTNDYWLFFESDLVRERVDSDGNLMARLVCRYDTDHNVRTINLMADLFENRFPTREVDQRRFAPA